MKSRRRTQVERRRRIVFNLIAAKALRVQTR